MKIRNILTMVGLIVLKDLKLQCHLQLTIQVPAGASSDMGLAVRRWFFSYDLNKGFLSMSFGFSTFNGVSLTNIFRLVSKTINQVLTP
jgi:hypothetical protein